MSLVDTKEGRNVRGDETIWRYMSFWKFTSMLHSSTLHFTRLDKFSDPFEGAFPKADLSVLHEALPNQDACYDSLAYMDQEGNYYGVGTEAERQQVRTWSDAAKLWRSVCYANCWHANEHESAAMWDFYTRANEGIAIQSTVARLTSSVADHSPQLQTAFINYFDYASDSFATTDGMLDLSKAILSKRKSFDHERELRAFFVGHWRDPALNSYDVAYDLDALITCTYVSPTSSNGFFDAVQVVMKAFGLAVPLYRSNLLDGPIW